MGSCRIGKHVVTPMEAMFQYVLPVNAGIV